MYENVVNNEDSFNQLVSNNQQQPILIDSEGPGSSTSQVPSEHSSPYQETQRSKRQNRGVPPPRYGLDE